MNKVEPKILNILLKITEIKKKNKSKEKEGNGYSIRKSKPELSKRSEPYNNTNENTYFKKFKLNSFKSNPDVSGMKKEKDLIDNTINNFITEAFINHNTVKFPLSSIKLMSEM